MANLARRVNRVIDKFTDLNCGSRRYYQISSELERQEECVAKHDDMVTALIDRLDDLTAGDTSDDEHTGTNLVVSSSLTQVVTALIDREVTTEVTQQKGRKTSTSLMKSKNV